ncbi:MAG TPA: hypothetical protein VIG37_22070 [Methylomirabilota bacterium]|jgi:hypothetical protein
MAGTKRKVRRPIPTRPKAVPQESPDPVRISVRLDPRLVHWAKLHAVQTASTVHEVVEVALVNHLKSHAVAEEELDARLMQFADRHPARRRR